MAALIEIQKLKNREYQIRVVEGRSESIHCVRMSDDDYQRLCGGKIDANELIRRSFEFLLARKSKESILPEFDLPMIGRYFPEYELELKRKI